MANITTCTNCGNCYEAGSEEQANEPTRWCAQCKPGTIGQIQVQGQWQGVHGTFIKANGAPASPILDGLHELYPWMKQHGWISEEHADGAFVPWRVRKV